MNTTDNLHLKKPETSDYYNVGDFNDNMDILDAKVHELDVLSAQLEEMLISGKVSASLTDEENVLTDDDGNELVANWRLKQV